MADRDRDPREPEAGSLDPETAARFDAYLEALLGEGRPSPDTVGDRDEAEMARMAAELAAVGRPDGSTVPDPAFVEQLRRRMREADTGIAAVRVPPPVRPAGRSDPTARWRLSRRDLLRAGMGAAAGMAAGMIGASLAGTAQRGTDVASRGERLVTGEGFWTDVARVEDVPPGTALRFSTTAFDGFVVNDGGTVRALSSVCSHMGCTLQFRPDWQDLRCPCHGASFGLDGALANGRRGWRAKGGYPGDARAYPLELPDLARPEVKVEDGMILVWTAQA
jgi:cytochrome b6-f complex iron-sulfur subunit